jgi:phosphoribosyl 1,2-cyclic phosphate phosphodiesterase
VTVLGSAGAWPIPRLGCDCPQCTSPDPRDRRLRASILIDGRILVDAGPDAYAQLLRAEAVPEQVVLTHHHHDHVLGLHVLAKLGRIPLHCTKECEQGVRAIFPRLDFRVMHLTPGVPQELGHDLRVQAFDVEHSPSSRTVALRFTGAAGESLVYAPDLAAPPGSRLARGADLLLLDGATRERPERGHLPMSEGVRAARRLRPGRLLFTHIGHRAGTHAELEEWLPDGVGVAHDGMEIDVAPAAG